MIEQELTHKRSALNLNHSNLTKSYRILLSIVEIISNLDATEGKAAALHTGIHETYLLLFLILK